VIPLHDVNPTTRRAVVTLVLIAVNVAVFLLVQQAQDGVETVQAANGQEVRIDSSLSFTYEWAAVPCEIVERRPLGLDEIEATVVGGDAEACARSEAVAGPALFPDKLEWVAVLVSMFLHGGWLHLGSNMLFLWVFGNNIEDRLGPVRYVLFYLLGGIVATVAHVAANPSSTVPVVGASGAIAAVMGAYLVWYPNARIRTVIFALIIFFTEIRARWLLGFWFVLQFFTSAESGVAWVAHVAGFAFGVAAAFLLGGGPSRMWGAAGGQDPRTRRRF
jgi:membrane associated rhomboid family serine protease